jgi:hypothetical protein
VSEESEVTHTHVLADFDNGFVVVLYTKSNTLNWPNVLVELIKTL